MVPATVLSGLTLFLYALTILAGLVINKLWSVGPIAQINWGYCQGVGFAISLILGVIVWSNTMEHYGQIYRPVVEIDDVLKLAIGSDLLVWSLAIWSQRSFVTWLWGLGGIVTVAVIAILIFALVLLAIAVSLAGGDEIT